jgi:hypothetical protein
VQALLEREAPSVRGEVEVRRQLDLAIGRALVEPRFAALLLADPAVALGAAGCSPQQHLQLRDIRAATLEDFARQAEVLFWPARQRSAAENTSLSRAVAL